MPAPHCFCRSLSLFTRVKIPALTGTLAANSRFSRAAPKELPAPAPRNLRRSFQMGSGASYAGPGIIRRRMPKSGCTGLKPLEERVLRIRAERACRRGGWAMQRCLMRRLPAKSQKKPNSISIGAAYGFAPCLARPAPIGAAHLSWAEEPSGPFFAPLRAWLKLGRKRAGKRRKMRLGKRNCEKQEGAKRMLPLSWRNRKNSRKEQTQGKRRACPCLADSLSYGRFKQNIIQLRWCQ